MRPSLVYKTVSVYLFMNFWQTPKASLEIKDLRLDLSKDPGSKPSVYLKLQMLPIVIHLGDNISCSKGNESLCAGDGSTIHKSSAHFICEEFGLLFEFGHHRFVSSMFINFTHRKMLEKINVLSLRCLL